MYIGFLFFRIFEGLSGGVSGCFINPLPVYDPGLAVVGVLLHPRNKIYQYTWFIRLVCRKNFILRRQSGINGCFMAHFGLNCQTIKDCRRYFGAVGGCLRLLGSAVGSSPCLRLEDSNQSGDWVLPNVRPDSYQTKAELLHLPRNPLTVFPTNRGPMY